MIREALSIQVHQRRVMDSMMAVMIVFDEGADVENGLHTRR